MILKKSASALLGVSNAFGKAVECKNSGDTSLFSVYEVFGPWATLCAQVLEDKAKKIMETMMKGTPAKDMEDDSDY